MTTEPETFHDVTSALAEALRLIERMGSTPVYSHQRLCLACHATSVAGRGPEPEHRTDCPIAAFWRNHPWTSASATR